MHIFSYMGKESIELCYTKTLFSFNVLHLEIAAVLWNWRLEDMQKYKQSVFLKTPKEVEYIKIVFEW